MAVHSRMELKTHDNYPGTPRRLRLSPRSTGVKVIIGPLDILIARAVHDAGMLSTPQIFAIIAPAYLNEKSLQQRLTILSNEENCWYEGKQLQGPFLHRPLHQSYADNARSNYLLYTLAPLSERILQKVGHFSDNRPKGLRPLPHAHFAATAIASLAVGFRKQGFEWGFQHEFLDQKGATLGAQVPYFWGDGDRRYLEKPRTLIPDGIGFAHYKPGYRLFHIEADNNTEPGWTTNDQRKSLRRNIAQGEQFVVGGQYQKHYHTEKVGLMTLNFFVTQARMDMFFEIVKVETGPNRYQCGKVVPEFQMPFKPRPIIDHIWQTPFKRYGHPDFDILDPQAR